MDELEDRAMFSEWSQQRNVSTRSLKRASLVIKQLDLTKKLRTIPVLGVVGSKGKGTSAVYASAAIAACGHKVGTITSPGVIANIDRVRIDGRVLSSELYQDMLNEILSVREKLPPLSQKTGYLSPSGLYMIGGVSTLIKEGCDAIVIEAGMGGRSDELSLFELDELIVTQIFNEHNEIIGPTLIDIARNKMGVLSARTRRIFSLPQADPVRKEVIAACDKFNSDLIWVNEETDDDSHATYYPPGHNRLNAVAGVQAGVALCKSIDTQQVSGSALRKTLETVHYPGRLSEHQHKEGKVIIDSAISRDGLVSAIAFAVSRFGRDPDIIAVSLHRNKDLEGFIQELQSVNSRKVFVNIKKSHAPYPSRAAWPWDWIEDDELHRLLETGTVLVVGTAYYSAFVLKILGDNTNCIFRVQDR
ncbi:MAG: hypothetical protein JWP06_677 [Candidatus Saccharibacteria bacterium]|nr:hypothetical protein [Candidatus Saccharibacteria bacterium]